VEGAIIPWIVARMNCERADTTLAVVCGVPGVELYETAIPAAMATRNYR
jgi:hypothetical protein